MSKLTIALFCAVLFGMGTAGGLYVRAADPAPSTQPAVDPKPINSKCIVSGEDLDPKITTVYKGVTYGFCCDDCRKKFIDNPEKYISAEK